jgi:hypothetical protein
MTDPYDYDDPFEVEAIQIMALDRSLALMAQWDNLDAGGSALKAAQAYAAISLAASHRLDTLGGIPDKEPSLCEDCGQEVTPGRPGNGDWEWYMVHNDVWAKAGMQDGFLCIGCLEQRLGRPLTGADFIPEPPINQPKSDFDTPRLLALKRAAAELHAQAVLA